MPFKKKSGIILVNSLIHIHFILYMNSPLFKVQDHNIHPKTENQQSLFLINSPDESTKTYQDCGFRKPKGISGLSVYIYWENATLWNHLKNKELEISLGLVIYFPNKEMISSSSSATPQTPLQIRFKPYIFLLSNLKAHNIKSLAEVHIHNKAYIHYGSKSMK